MRDSRAASLRFTLVASAALLSMLAQAFFSAGGLHWAVAPLVVAVACLFLEAPRGRRDRSEPSNRQRSHQMPLDFDVQPPKWGFDLWNVRFSRSDIARAIIIAACMLMFVSLRSFGQERADDFSLAWRCFGSAVAFLLAGIAIADGRLIGAVNRVRKDGGLRVELRSLTTWLLLGAILLTATAVRIYDLEDIPAGLYHDEAITLKHAREYAEDPGSIPVFEPSVHRPTLYYMPVAALVELAGVSVTVPRLIAAAFGVLGVLATFLVVRRALGVSGGLIAAFLVAFMRWDIIFSRIGFDATAGVLFAALTGWLAFRAIRSGRHSDYALAGACLGLGMWFYIANQAFGIVIGFILLHHLAVARPPFRKFALSVCVMALTALFVAAPVAQFAIDNPDEFFARSRQVSIFDIFPRDEWFDQIREGLKEHASMFNRLGDPNPRHNLPDAPTLDFIMGGLFALGFFFALTQWRNTTLFCLPFWALFMILPGALTLPWESPQSLRSILAIPAVAALAAYPLQRLWDAARGAPWPSVRRYALPVLLCILAVIAYLNVEFYFDDQANDPRVFAAFSTDETLMARSHAEWQRKGYSIWTSRQYLFGPVADALDIDVKRGTIKPPETLPLDSDRIWDGAAIYFEPRERGFWELTRAYYPDGQFDAVTAPNSWEPLFYTAFVSRDSVARRQGLDVEYMSWNQEIDEGRRDLRESVWHTADGPEQYPYNLDISGALKVDMEGEYEFALDGDLDAYVELDGLRILSPEKRRSKVEPAIGLHSLSIVGSVNEPDRYVRLLWKPPGGELEPIPFSHLYRGDARPLGAVGRFFANDNESGLPDAMEIVPSMDAFRYLPVIDEPHTVIWDGILELEELGSHRFAVEGTSGPLKFYFEGDLLAQDPPSNDVGGEGEVLVGSGSYPIRIEYVAATKGRSTMFEILWQPPGGNMAPIPVEAVTPVRERALKVIE